MIGLKVVCIHFIVYILIFLIIFANTKNEKYERERFIY